MVKMKEGLTLIGVREDCDALVLTQVLMLRHMASFKEMEGGLLEEITEADQVSENVNNLMMKNVPMMNIPDESLIVSESLASALAKKWPLEMDLVITFLEVDDKSLIGRFYADTLKLLYKDKKIVSKLFSVCDLNTKILEGVYDEKKTKKYFVVRG